MMDVMLCLRFLDDCTAHPARPYSVQYSCHLPHNQLYTCAADGIKQSSCAVQQLDQIPDGERSADPLVSHAFPLLCPFCINCCRHEPLKL